MVSTLKPASALSRIHPPDVDENGKYFTPLDIFSPEYYNTEMDIEERALFAENGIAFASPDECATPEQINAWKSMGLTEFMEQYGEVILSFYDCPTAEEVEEEMRRREAAENGEEAETDLEDTDSERNEGDDANENDVEMPTA
ncbi:hypothetical protein C8F01DRAFT_1268703 [Mycena amicta]|nr:hypothetical protein C8F01DRAFT_1268703 [Mycena amicta]